MKEWVAGRQRFRDRREEYRDRFERVAAVIRDYFKDGVGARDPLTNQPLVTVVEGGDGYGSQVYEPLIVVETITRHYILVGILRIVDSAYQASPLRWESGQIAGDRRGAMTRTMISEVEALPDGDLRVDFGGDSMGRVADTLRGHLRAFENEAFAVEG